MYNRRPLKFRFFCPAAKGFIQGYKYNGLVEELFDEDPLLIPSQYTGIKDVNNKEVYEGDVVEYSRFNLDDGQRGIVEYVEGAFLVKTIKPTGTLSFFWLHQFIDYEIKIRVVGNIYETSEATSQ